MKRSERTRIMVEGDLALVQSIADDVVNSLGQDALCMLEEPHEELVMIQVRDTAKGERFYLGEALVTACRVRVSDVDGLGIVMGYQPERAYALAVIDAAFAGAVNSLRLACFEEFLTREACRLSAAQEVQDSLVGRTKVNFSTMDVEV